MRVEAPRIVIAAPASGGGKTTFSCGLMQAFVNRGLRVQACKCGPDYIDPMFHREVIGAASHNLDLFFMNGEQVCGIVAEGATAADVTVVEGVMGYYDGIAVSDTASAWDVACALDAPAILLIDGRGRARSIAAEVLGFARFRENSHVEGVVLNRVSPMIFPQLKELIEAETGVRVYGYIPVLEGCSLESRHLGLVTASEVADLREKLSRVADALEKSIDLDALVELASQTEPLECFDQCSDSGRFHALDALVEPASQAEPLESRKQRDESEHPHALDTLIERASQTEPLESREEYNEGEHPHADCKIAVAWDDAFCFYYDDTLRILERMGAEIALFSPLTDARLPEGACGLYLGGGYPELHAQKLSENTAMLAAVRDAIEAGMPTIAECGGFMYLHSELEDDAGHTWPMAGVVDARAFRTPTLGRFGYVTLTPSEDSLLCATGESLRAHEFHYWDSTAPGNAFHATKPQSARSWNCAYVSPSLYAGFPHLCLHAQPEAAARFVSACTRWKRQTQ